MAGVHTYIHKISVIIIFLRSSTERSYLVTKGKKDHIRIKLVTITTWLTSSLSLPWFYMPGTGLSHQQICVTVNIFKSKNHYCLCFKYEGELRPRDVHDLQKATQSSVWEPGFESLISASHPEPANHVSMSVSGCNMDISQMSSVYCDRCV